ncbi:transposase [Gluconobacter frateurii NBRC 101659]|nr:transposase [Gluconobacter frateurii NBRC 101659]
MTAELKEAGLNFGERRVGWLMKLNGIRLVRTRQHKVTTDSRDTLGFALNTLAAVIDLFSRRIIGWSASDRMKKDFVIRALDMTVRLRLRLRLRMPSPGCIFHSDRGSQYCSHDFQQELTKYKMIPFMSGKRNSFDNAAVETFFKSLKAELLW